MLRRSRFLLLVLAFQWGRSAAQDLSSWPPLTLAQYTQVLDSARHLANEMKDEPARATTLLDSIPVSSWRVHDNGHDFEISTTSLRYNLQEWQRDKDEELEENIVAQLDSLLADAQAYQNSSTAPDRRVLLNSILARPEFNSVHGPGLIDRLKQKIFQLLLRLLGRAFASSAFPVLSDIVVYGLIILAVLGVAYWMYRSLKESANLETIMPQPLPVSAKQWPIWLQEARAAASRGDWREAIHHTYWSGISFLEAQGAWRPDSARTPREYLRLLPSHSEKQPALRSLTNRLEFVWYGMGPANAEFFQQTLLELEKLGCPCN
jgi:Domain of unknown function (DUF4129)